MSPVTHFLTGWLIASIPGKLNNRERAMIAFAGVIADLDGIGIIAELLTANSSRPLLWFSEYHHLLGHNIGFAIVVTLICAIFAERRILTAILVLISFHAHLFCDLIGSRGPDGYQWPIPYLLPFSHRWQWSWQGQWQLNAWPNFLITFIELSLVFLLAWQRGYSPLGIFSRAADRRFIETLYQRFPRQ